MATKRGDPSDWALSVFAFAAYHRLLSGERVPSVIRKDGRRYEADPVGVAELEENGFATSTPADFAATIVASMWRETGR